MVFVGPIFQRPWGLSFILILFFISPALATLVNVTVDDETGDSMTGAKPTYTPAGNWSQGPTCSGCFVKPEAQLALGGTWHDSTTPPNATSYTITYKFTGTAVYAFFILANQVPYATTYTNLSFTLDGDLAGVYSHLPDNTTNYAYNVSGFAKIGLSNNEHTIVISNESGTNASLVLFDYLIYTIDDGKSSTSTLPSSSVSSTLTGVSSGSGSPPSQLSTSGATPTSNTGDGSTDSSSNGSDSSSSPPSTSTKNMGAIIGGAAAGAFAIMLAALGLLCCTRKSRLRQRFSDSFGRDRQQIEPYDAAPASAKAGGEDEMLWAHRPGLVGAGATQAHHNQSPSGATASDARDGMSLLPQPSRPPTYVPARLPNPHPYAQPLNTKLQLPASQAEAVQLQNTLAPVPARGLVSKWSDESLRASLARRGMHPDRRRTLSQPNNQTHALPNPHVPLPAIPSYQMLYSPDTALLASRTATPGENTDSSNPSLSPHAFAEDGHWLHAVPVYMRRDAAGNGQVAPPKYYI